MTTTPTPTEAAPLSDAVAAVIRARLAHTGRTQTELAEQIGTTQVALSRRLSHRAAPRVPIDLDELARIAIALDTTAADLVTTAEAGA